MSIQFLPFQNFGSFKVDKLNNMVMGRICLGLFGHEHKHSVAHLDVDQNCGKEYLFGLVGELADFVIAEYQDLGVAGVNEHHHSLMTVLWVRNWSYFPDCSKPSQRLMLHYVLTGKKLFLTIHGTELKNTILVNVLPKKYQTSLWVQFFEHHPPCVEFFGNKIFHFYLLVLQSGTAVVIDFSLVFLDLWLFDIEFIAFLENMELSLRKNIFFLILVMYFGLWQFADLLKASFLNIEQHQSPRLKNGTQYFMPRKWNSLNGSTWQFTLI